MLDLDLIQPNTQVNPLSLGKCCDEWLQLNRSRIKASSYVKYWTILEKHIKPHLGARPIGSLDAVAIEEFSHFLLSQKALSAKTVRDILAVLRSVLRYTHKHHALGQPPVEIVYPRLVKAKMRILSRDEQMRFTACLLQDMDSCKFGIMLSMLTGLRIGEICALKWGNISLENSTLSVEFTMQRLQDPGNDYQKTRVLITSPKSDTSCRVIPLTSFAAGLCRQMQCEEPDAYVLTGSSEHYIEPRLLQYKLDRYTKACGLEGVHFHTLRHTFATRCIEVDFEIKSLSEILGHSSPKITLERYVHPSMDIKRSNMNKLTTIGF